MEPASIRYKNPGAMWGGNAISKKWGESGNVKLNDGMGQNNHIAVFPDFVHGIAAQIDLWRTARYHNKRFADAIKVWSGGNWVESYIKFVMDRVPGMTRDTIMSDAMLASPMGLAFLKAQAWHEAGKRYPATDAEFAQAQKLVFGGAVVKTPASTAKKVVVSTGSALPPVAVAVHHGLSLPVALAIGVAIAVVIFILWKVSQAKVAAAPPVLTVEPPPSPAQKIVLPLRAEIAVPAASLDDGEPNK